MKKRFPNADARPLEIDYDKLAEAIVKAQATSSKKAKKKGKIRGSLMGTFNGCLYAGVYSAAALSIYAVWHNFKPENYPLISCIILTIILVIVAVYAFLCQQESFDDDAADSREYFNTNVSLIALIIAFVALFKGVA